MKRLISLALFALLMSCATDKSLESITIDQENIVMHYTDSKQLNVVYNPSDAEPKPAVTWFSENRSVARVSSDGLVEGVRIGETRIKAKADGGRFQDYCDIIIKPISNLFIKPVLKWGFSMSYIVETESRILYDAAEDALLFLGENPKVSYVVYFFYEDQLVSVIVGLKEEDSVLREAKIYLEERYPFLRSNDTGVYFEVSDSEIVALAYNETLGHYILYQERPSTKSGEMNSAGINMEMIGEMVSSGLPN